MNWFRKKEIPERYWWKLDTNFNELYHLSLVKAGKVDRTSTKERSYTLQQLFKLVLTRFDRLQIVECGVASGSTAYQLATLMGNKGILHLFDSFEGLPEREAEDATVANPASTGKGVLSYSLEHVTSVLKEFTTVIFHQGWIPNTFEQLPEEQYHFVHIDVDLYNPTKESLAYFYPRLQKGGIIVCDDYGFTAWPGAKKAVEEFGVPFISLSTGQAVFMK